MSATKVEGGVMKDVARIFGEVGSSVSRDENVEILLVVLGEYFSRMWFGVDDLHDHHQ